MLLHGSRFYRGPRRTGRDYGAFRSKRHYFASACNKSCREGRLIVSNRFYGDLILARDLLGDATRSSQHQSFLSRSGPVTITSEELGRVPVRPFHRIDGCRCSRGGPVLPASPPAGTFCRNTAHGARTHQKALISRSRASTRTGLDPSLRRSRTGAPTRAAPTRSWSPTCMSPRSIRRSVSNICQTHGAERPDFELSRRPAENRESPALMGIRHHQPVPAERPKSGS